MALVHKGILPRIRITFLLLENIGTGFRLLRIAFFVVCIVDVARDIGGKHLRVRHFGDEIGFHRIREAA